ncbi:MAG: EAL domain-containing protein [Chloroflexi bacterium]|nr:EAL domain-containing protein [Chloroflexota bacterium]
MNSVKKRTLASAMGTLLLYQLLLPIIIASILTLVVVSYFTANILETQQERFNDSISYSIEDFIEYSSRELDAIAFMVSDASIEDINMAMQAQWSSYDIFETFYLLDSHGMIITLTPMDQRYLGFDMSRSEYYLSVECTKDINISSPFPSLRTGEPIVYLSRCIDDKYLLVGELNLNSLQETVYANQPRLPEACVFVVDQRGTILAHPDFEHVTKKDNISNWEIVDTGLREEESTIYYWRDGNFWFSTAESIDPMGWLVITEIQFGVVFGPYIVAGLGMVFFLLLIFSVSLQRFSIAAQRQVVFPLTKLGQSSDALASGDYEKSQVLGQDTYSLLEIERLVDNFQNMRQAIISRATLLRESEKQYRRLVENSPDAILVHHNGIAVYVNNAALQLYKAENLETVIGMQVLDFIHMDSKDVASARLQRIDEAGYTIVMPMIEQKHVKFDGTVFDAEVITSSIFFEGRYEAQTIIRDISRRKDEEIRLQYQVSHDFLTNLPNRFFLEDVLERTLAKAKRAQTVGAILYLDLDGFKAINDTYGHATGDVVLKVAAKKLENALRKGDIVARLGGDEFVVLVDTISSKKDVDQIANNILHIFSDPIMIGQDEIHLSLSIGVSLFPDDGETAQILLQTADTAMYEAKREGKDRFKFYSSQMRVQTEERIAIVTYLQYALIREEFTILYQPQMNAKTGNLTGAEALLRWNHPTRGLIRPGQFIDLAEETGLILPIGEWMLKKVCEQIKQWEELVPEDFHIAINLSNLQLMQPNMVSIFEKNLSNSGINPSMLEIELMENIVFQNPREALNKLFKIKSMGIKLAIDDFGTGYSMLGYLAHFPFDHLKIDQRLAPNLPVDNKEVAIVSGVITIGQDLGLTVIAEGVETIEQVNFYKSLGIHDFQGWYFSHEITVDEMTKVLKNNFLS